MHNMLTYARFSFVFCVVLTACSHRAAKDDNGRIPITFVSTSQLRHEESLTGRKTPGAGEYETWERLHSSLCDVAKRYGRVSGSADTPLPDFYHSGDWYDELWDGFTLYSTKGLSKQALRELQAVVAAHHADASVLLVGDADQIVGLEVLMTSTHIFVSWENASPEQCREKLNALGINLE